MPLWKADGWMRSLKSFMPSRTSRITLSPSEERWPVAPSAIQPVRHDQAEPAARFERPRPEPGRLDPRQPARGTHRHPAPLGPQHPSRHAVQTRVDQQRLTHERQLPGGWQSAWSGGIQNPSGSANPLPPGVSIRVRRLGPQRHPTGTSRPLSRRPTFHAVDPQPWVPPVEPQEPLTPEMQALSDDLESVDDRLTKREAEALAREIVTHQEEWIDDAIGAGDVVVQKRRQQETPHVIDRPRTIEVHPNGMIVVRMSMRGPVLDAGSFKVAKCVALVEPDRSGAFRARAGVKLRMRTRTDDERRLALRELGALDDARGKSRLVQALASRQVKRDSALRKITILEDFYEHGNLHRVLSTGRALDRDEKRRLMLDVLAGAASIHDDLNGVHCDFKPENILVRRERGILRAGVTDLGFLVRHEHRSRGISPYYAAPEVAAEWLEGQRLCVAPVRRKSGDLFALGMVLWEICYGAPAPFPQPSEDAPPEATLVERSKMDERAYIAAGLQTNAPKGSVRRLLEDMISWDTERRPSARRAMRELRKALPAPVTTSPERRA
jgi:serine/threonine protein kinase